LSPAPRRREHSLGVALTVTSSVTFGAAPVLAKAAFGAGVGVSSLLGARFAIAAVLLWAVIAIRRPSFPPLRMVAAALALGGVGFAAEAALYFSALERLDASLVVLLLATYPAIVVVVAVALGRERADRRRGLALGASIGGAALVLGGAHVTGLDGVGVVFAASAAVAYASYVLLADRVAEKVDGLILAALVITGAATATLGTGAASGSLDFAIDGEAWLTIAALASLCTVVPIASFLFALPRIGPGTASIVSGLEAVVAVILAAILLGDALSPAQLAGAALVLGATLAMQLAGPVSGSSSVGGDDPAPAAPAAAGALA
jgi:drug/metabolite transporter (DMT)-like permease